MGDEITHEEQVATAARAAFPFIKKLQADGLTLDQIVEGFTGVVETIKSHAPKAPQGDQAHGKD